MSRKLTDKPDYNKVYFSKGELILIFIKGIFGLILISYLFYRSWIAFICLLPFMLLFVKREKKKKKEKRQRQLKLQFKDGIQMLLAELEAGYSIENAFVEALKELQKLYAKQDDIVREFRTIVNGIDMNNRLELLLQDFAFRSNLEDIKNFAEVFSIAKKSGGDMVNIIRTSIRTIQDKIEVEQEIEIMIAGKKLEQKIMNIVPIGILIYVNLTSAEFLSVLYHSFMGTVVMSGCLCLYLAAFYIGSRIVEVEI